MQDNVIEVNNLSLPYCFCDFNISFERNKLTVITGPNNCGKTTLIRSIIGQFLTNSTIYVFSQALEYYRITELNMIMKCIIPKEYIFTEESVLKELENSLNNIETSVSSKQKKIKELMKQLNIIKLQNKNPKELLETEKIKVQLIKHLLQSPKILLLDDILIDMTKEERKSIINILRQFQEKMDLTIIMTTSNLEDCISCDYVYVVDNNAIALEGTPKEVLTKDNVLNRIGLELPFMVDLSVKLHDYDLLDDIELDISIDRMVDQLWK